MPTASNLAEEILRVLDRHPDRPALHVLDKNGDTARKLSCGELVSSTEYWRQQFLRGGLRPGQRIVLSPQRSTTMPALHLAALAMRLSVVPLNPSLSTREARSLLASAKPALAVTTTAVANVVQAAKRRSTGASAPTVPWWIIDESEPATPASAWHDASTAADPRKGADADDNPSEASSQDADIALLLFTSGTTGRPKSVPLTHENLLANLRALGQLWQRGPEDRVLHMLPAHHFHGLVLALYGSLLAGSEIVMLPAFDARAALDAVARHGINLVMGVPTMYARMLDAAGDTDNLSGLRLAISGSAPLSSTLWHRVHDRFGLALIERYGLTETGIVSSNPPDAPRAGSVGKPLPGTKVVIETSEGYCEARADKASPRGEICVAGPAVTAGYGNDPDANAAAFRDGLFHTGDLGVFDEDGYLRIDGRIKELIIVGGSNVVPGEVAAALCDVDGIAEVAVVGIAHEDLGEVVAALVVASAAASQEVLTRRLRRRAEERLARYKRPRAYAFVQEIPRNAMGKTDVAACRAALTGISPFSKSAKTKDSAT